MPDHHETKPNRRVLLIDDNEDALAMMGALCKLWGHTVSMELEGLLGIATAERERPEIVLIDISLPDIDGFEVARRLRQNSDLAGAVLIAVTGYSSPETTAKAREAGFDLHLVKPVAMAKLRGLLHDPATREPW